jgi:GNAT acetyltransferase-like protein
LRAQCQYLARRVIDMPEADLPFSDLELARRLERAEGTSGRRFVEGRAVISPGCGAAWIEVAGTLAMFDGVDSPVTQTFGLGLSGPATLVDLESLERFFQDRGARVHHEVSPLAGVELARMLSDRGYHPIEFTSILYRSLSRDLVHTESRNNRIEVRPITSDETELWANTSAQGWSQEGNFLELMREFGRVSVRSEGAVPFLAWLDGQPAAAGTVIIAGDVALLAGASTVPAARRKGAQLALLDARLRHAANQGCDVAMMGAAPGSASQRNSERHGFRIAYTRTKWEL